MRLVRTAGVTRAIDLSILSAVLTLVGACTLLPHQPALGPVPEVRPGVLKGYLSKASLPDSLQLLPPPPARGSARMAGDIAVSRVALRLRGTARWALARRDAVLAFPKGTEAFDCAAGLHVSKDGTPNLYRVLGRAETDAGQSTRRAKKYYKRRRPFLLNGKPICTPGDKAYLAKQGSYPSGHTTIGWAWALVLSELIPDRADRILLRGRQFGESRLVCNVHWNTDVLAGRTLAAAVVARLHGDPAFRAAMRAARREIAAARRRGPAPGAACKREAEVLERTHLYGR